ncbi:MAG: hypothetical protein K6D54_07665 [Bacteroidales bacterium]|nr:hypothetical protein [Bacteroidales bacterium]
MEELFKLLNEAKDQALLRIRSKQKSGLESFVKIANGIRQSYKDNGTSAYGVIDFDSEFLPHQEESQKIPTCIRIGSLTPVNANPNVKEKATVPFLFPYTEANATTFILKKNDARNIHILFSLIAFRLMLSLSREMFRMWFVDNNYGRDFNIISKIDPKIIGNSIITSHSDLVNLVASLEKTMVSTYQKLLITEETLVEYNAKAGNMAQPYTFVFISNFPSQFSQETSERLINMISNGNAAKAGIFFFISVDESIQPARGVDVERLKEVSSVIYQNSPIDYEIHHNAFSKAWNDSFNIVLDSRLPDSFDKIVDLINGKKVKNNTLSLVPEYKQRWERGDIWKAETTEEIKIPIGFVNSQTVQNLQFGKYTNDYFGLIGGLPRMGKTNLLHNIILWGAMEYSPFELNYYLIDCKNGTGFNVYRQLPHVRILSISNDREFGASSLDSLVQEMYKRADIFKKASTSRGVLIENIQTYRTVTGEKMPRILAIVDEFQVLFENEDKIARMIRSTLNKLFREGPAFGISIILSSQGIGGVDVPIKNITWRLSFRLLSDIESQRILGNDGALKLTRVGNAIINNQNGEKSGNVSFQVALIGDELYDYVNKLRDKFRKEYPENNLTQFLSDGDNNGHVERNKALVETIRKDRFNVNDRYCDIYIGEPAFIRDKHAFIRIRRQQGSNIVMVGKDTKSALTITGMINYMLDRQSSPGSRFYVVDCFNIDNDYAERMGQLEEYSSNMEVSYSRNIGATVGTVYSALEERIAAENNGERAIGRICLSIVYMQNCRALKKEGYNPSPVTKQLIRIIKEGPEYGIHVLLHSLTYQGLTEVLDASAINEFENRIALDSGKSMSIISESTSSQISSMGTVLLQGPDEFMTYNPDLVRVYSVFNHSGFAPSQSSRFIDELLKI